MFKFLYYSILNIKIGQTLTLGLIKDNTCLYKVREYTQIDDFESFKPSGFHRNPQEWNITEKIQRFNFQEYFAHGSLLLELISTSFLGER